MTEREALKLALEALKHTHPSPLTSFYTIGDRDKAIKAIEEHLAQPEQEPVAWIEGDEAILTWIKTEPEATPLYTTPPQRTWVGLTDDEIDQGLLRSDYAFKTAEAWRAGVVFAMTKLKEKNT